VRERSLNITDIIRAKTGYIGAIVFFVSISVAFGSEVLVDYSQPTSKSNKFKDSDLPQALKGKMYPTPLRHISVIVTPEGFIPIFFHPSKLYWMMRKSLKS
jgi:hypothetical protein